MEADRRLNGPKRSEGPENKEVGTVPGMVGVLMGVGLGVGVAKGMGDGSLW